MKKIITLVYALCLSALPLMADVDERFVFLDEEGEIIEDGSTVVRNVVEDYGEGVEVVYSGIYVMNMGAGANDVLKMHYTISRIDNGSYQICFPTTCNTQDEVGTYETSQGALMGDIQDIQSEWFPTADGVCEVTLSIEVLTKQGLFPPTYVHSGDGPTITLRFEKGEQTPVNPKGDVNGDKAVNIADINALISIILGRQADEQTMRRADVNGDSAINIADINAVIAIILNTAE